jgi:amino acid transporter
MKAVIGLICLFILAFGLLLFLGDQIEQGRQGAEITMTVIILAIVCILILLALRRLRALKAAAIAIGFIVLSLVLINLAANLFYSAGDIVTGATLQAWQAIAIPAGIALGIWFYRRQMKRERAELEAEQMKKTETKSLKDQF